MTKSSNIVFQSVFISTATIYNRIPPTFTYILSSYTKKGGLTMSRKRIFDAVLLSLTIAYVITKAIAGFECDTELSFIEDIWNDEHTDSS